MKIIDRYPLNKTEGEIGIEIEVEGQNLGFTDRTTLWNLV